MSSHLERTGTTGQEATAAGGPTPLAAKGYQLLRSIKPFVTNKDIAGLLQFLEQSGWAEQDLIALLTCSDPAIVRIATWTLAYAGTMQASLPLASVLHSQDTAAADLAENALWSLWLRAASDEDSKRLCKAIRLAEQDCCDRALAQMDGLIACCPGFAEAYNQRAIVRFLMSDYQGALKDYQKAFELNSVHFGALAGVGHCYAAMGCYRDALNAYRRVLTIHPRMEGIRQAIGQIRRMVGCCGKTGRMPTYWTLS